MKQKKNPDLKVVEPTNLEKLKANARRRKRKKARRYMIAAVLAIMIIVGTYLLVKNQSYTGIREAASYGDETSDSNRYAQFGKGIVRYSRDGIVYLNRKNEEQWIWPCQMKNPVIDVSEETFAVADSEGNSILVFTEEGLKGEIETTLPIEKMSVSNQGIVSAILKNESSPKIVSYDATGNILVEHQVTVSSTGYPLAMDMSGNGTVLAVSYLSTKEGAMKSKVAFYNFGEAGKDKTDHQVGLEEYDGEIIPEVYFMDDTTSVAVSDSSFIIYEGQDTPKKKQEVQLNQEIKSVFHTDEYIGFVLLNKNKSGYEARLYDKAGKQVMNKAFTGEYSNIKMIKDEIIMYSGSKCCIITKNGVQRFKGDLKAEALEIIPARGINRYLVMSANELRIIYLTK